MFDVSLAEVSKALAGVIALTGATVTIRNYRKSVQTKRAEWLSSLHEKFFETTRYADVRRILDYKPDPEHTQLRQAIETETHLPITDEFYRYLNFFELLASLRKLKQISDDEMIALFQYDLDMISQQEFIVNAVNCQGFERLALLIESRRHN